MEPDVSIQSLLDKIKREGIEKANRSSEEILEKARSQARDIIESAKGEAERTVSEAQSQLRQKQEIFEQEMSRAARDLLLGVKNDIIRLCRHIIERQVHAALTPEVMKEMILKMIDKWQIQNGEAEMEILLNERDQAILEDLLHQSLQHEFRRGIILKPIEKIEAGFFVGEKEGTMHYDLTNEGIAEILGEYLSARIADFLKGIRSESAHES